MYRIAICNENKKDSEKIRQCVQQYTEQREIIAEQKIYALGIPLIDDAKTGIQYDIYILDIEMQDIFGITAVKELKKASKDAIVIFVTSHLQYALESFELEIFRYIPKETLEERLPEALEAAFLKLEREAEAYYLINDAKRVQKVFYKDVIYVYKEDKNSNFVLTDGTEIKIRLPIFAVYQKLPADTFIKADRSDIVNLAYVRKVDLLAGKLCLKNKIELDVSKRRLQEIKGLIDQLWGEKGQ